jgi:hypothetical protein
MATKSPVKGKSPPLQSKGKAAGITEERGEVKPDAETGPSEPHGGANTAPPRIQQHAPVPSDAHHIAAATSIAHAILGSRQGSY